MTDSTLLVIGAAVLLLAVVLLVLARTGRKPIEGPVAAEPLSPPEPLPEPEAAPGLATAELGPPPIALAEGPPDELTRMKGLGPKAAALLAGMGVTRYDQIAAWNAADIARVDAQMGAFQGRIARDRWVEQAGFFAAGDIAGFEATFGKIG
jgi:predicted flap endonuclease-1-like 5' DNA nuclease